MGFEPTVSAHKRWRTMPQTARPLGPDTTVTEDNISARLNNNPDDIGSGVWKTPLWSSVYSKEFTFSILFNSTEKIFKVQESNFTQNAKEVRMDRNGGENIYLFVGQEMQVQLYEAPDTHCACNKQYNCTNNGVFMQTS
jgi:hypothetical protein